MIEIELIDREHDVGRRQHAEEQELADEGVPVAVLQRIVEAVVPLIEHDVDGDDRQLDRDHGGEQERGPPSGLRSRNTDGRAARWWRASRRGVTRGWSPVCRQRVEILRTRAVAQWIKPDLGNKLISRQWEPWPYSSHPARFDFSIRRHEGMITVGGGSLGTSSCGLSSRHFRPCGTRWTPHRGRDNSSLVWGEISPYNLPYRNREPVRTVHITKRLREGREEARESQGGQRP